MAEVQVISNSLELYARLGLVFLGGIIVAVLYTVHLAFAYYMFVPDTAHYWLYQKR